MIGIIPAAGYGTRIGLPYPKELLPITVRKDRVVTVIETNLIQLAEAGITEAVVVIRPEKQIIKDYLGDCVHGVRLTYVNQTTRLSREGLPDAISNALKALSIAHNAYVMLMGDVYFTPPETVRHLVNSLLAKPRALAGIATWVTDEPHRFGIVSHEHHWVTSVIDKPEITGMRQMWGAVAFTSEFARFVHNERDTLSHALHWAATSRDRAVFCTQALGEYLDLGTPASFVDGFKRANK